ncbi:MAG: hypothetical protein IKU34_06420 [Clostridia bacterium]|nr:hypothetical protein [Clostridia bacterium]
MDIRITKAKVKNHWHYSWWKYLVIAVVCVLGVDMLFATTRYRPPADKKIELYLCSGYADASQLYEELWPVFKAASPEQEELTIVNIDLTGNDSYANMQFTTYIGAQQGDVLLLPTSYLKALVREGADEALYCLDEYQQSGLLDVPGVDLNVGMLSNVDGTKGLYAIPADSLYGLTKFNCDPADSMLCVMGFTMNPENAVEIINLMFDLYQTEKPDWYDGMRKEKETQQSTQLFR